MGKITPITTQKKKKTTNRLDKSILIMYNNHIARAIIPYILIINKQREVQKMKDTMRTSFGDITLDDLNPNVRIAPKGMLVGYIRVSTEEQNTARQEELMRTLGVERVFIDKASGKTTESRPQLKVMMEFLREGDTLVVSEISRFARSTRDLLDLVDKLNKKGVKFVSKKEAIDTSTPTGEFMLTVFGAIAQLERAYIIQRQQEGVKIAKAAGKYKGRKPVQIDMRLFEQEYVNWKMGYQTAQLTIKKLGLKQATFYRKVKEYEQLQRDKLKLQNEKVKELNAEN